MILLDTHVWVWLTHGDTRLPSYMSAMIEISRLEGLAVSAISCWEVAKLVEKGRLKLPRPTLEWMEAALDGSGIAVVPLSKEVAVASASLPGDFHGDPADQIIVATARLHDLRLATCDEKILNYAYVRTLTDSQIHDR